jgi:hypothetical protein
MRDNTTINNVGQLIAYVGASVAEHDATPFTEVRVRIGANGPEHKIAGLFAVQDQRGFSLVLQGAEAPERG